MDLEAIVAVYADWGIGADGTQPVVLKADRAHFRAVTGNAAVIVGRRTLGDFPGGRPLKGRHNIVVTRQDLLIEGAEVVHSTEEALAAAARQERCLVIGGASVYRQFFPHLNRVFLTKIDLTPHSDSFFPDLDALADWVCTEEGAWLTACATASAPTSGNSPDAASRGGAGTKKRLHPSWDAGVFPFLSAAYFLASPSGKMILLTMKKITIETPPLSTTVTML